MLTLPRKRNRSVAIGTLTAVCLFSLGVYTVTTLAEPVPTNKVNQTVGSTPSNSAASETPVYTPARPTWPLKGQALFNDGKLIAQKRPAAIANQPTAHWIGDWNPAPAQEVHDLVTAAAAVRALPTIVLYNIPERDCGQYSAGGAKDSASYRAWIQAVADGLAQQPAIIVLEPDALPHMSCLTKTQQKVRLADIRYAVKLLAGTTRASIYLDAGNSNWKSADETVAMLKQASISDAAGFSLNVAGFAALPAVTAYGNAIAAKLGGVHYIVDTSRNGRGAASDNAWCNPGGRGLGEKPTTTPANSTYIDAYLWIKTPGESDGTCNGGPTAGQWFESYAQSLITNAAQ